MLAPVMIDSDLAGLIASSLGVFHALTLDTVGPCLFGSVPLSVSDLGEVIDNW